MIAFCNHQITSKHYTENVANIKRNSSVNHLLRLKMIMNMDDGHKEIEEYQQMSGIFKIMVILLVRTKTGQKSVFL
jgi:hypothetical protein